MKTAVAQLEPMELLTLLEQQRDLYRRLRELSDKQRSVIAGDRPEMLLGILRDRQDLVAALARLNDRLAPYRRNWDSMYAALPEAQRAGASELLQEINGLLRVILRTDQEDGALLAARKQSVAVQAAGLTSGRAANTAYGRQAGRTGTPRSADLRG
jgi:hypothetical protein